MFVKLYFTVQCFPAGLFFGSTFTTALEFLDLIMECVEYISEIVSRRIKSRIKPKPHYITLIDL